MITLFRKNRSNDPYEDEELRKERVRKRKEDKNKRKKQKKERGRKRPADSSRLQ